MLNPNSDWTFQGAFSIDILKHIGKENPKFKPLIDWLAIQVKNLIFDHTENFWHYQSNMEFDRDGHIENIDETPSPQIETEHNIDTDCSTKNINVIDHLIHLPTFKNMSKTRKKHIAKLNVLHRSNKMLASQTLSSFSRYQQLMHRVFNAWHLYSHRKFIAKMIAKRLAAIKASKLTIFRAWKRVTVINKISSLQKQIDSLQTQMRHQKIDRILIEQLLHQDPDEDAIKTVIVTACDFLNDQTCAKCNKQWTQKYSDSFRKNYSHIELFKTLL